MNTGRKVLQCDLRGTGRRPGAEASGRLDNPAHFAAIDRRRRVPAEAGTAGLTGVSVPDNTHAFGLARNEAPATHR